MDKVDADNWRCLLGKWRRANHLMALAEANGYTVRPVIVTSTDPYFSPLFTCHDEARLVTVELTSSQLERFASSDWGWY